MTLNEVSGWWKNARFANRADDGMFFKIMTLTGFAESTKQHRVSAYPIGIGMDPQFLSPEPSG